MRLRNLVLPMMVVAPAGLWLAGGWAVVTVENPPPSLVAGVPYTLEYTVRQHGQTLLGSLNGQVEARGPSRTVRVDAKSGATVGRYSALLTIPDAGDWTITVKSGFGPSSTTMLPIKVVRAGAAVVDLADAERGRHLFAAKGCMTCHVEMKVAPDPRTQDYNEAFVRQLLADPASMPRRRPGDLPMPKLGLNQAEISALTAYLTGPNSTGTR